MSNSIMIHELETTELEARALFSQATQSTGWKIEPAQLPVLHLRPANPEIK